MYDIEDQLHKALKAIKENDGFPGPLKPMVRANILGKWATVEVSPLTGLDVQWKLTADGKRKLIQFNRQARWNKKYRERHVRNSNYTPDVVVPLTIEVLDALKSIRETGEPNTVKLDILARIQRYGIHGAQNINGHLVHGALAECKDGVWTLTAVGIRVEAGHIRKTDCAQFTGKVR